ncbi:general transcription factor II-I repeat domain-containing protein 2B-like [Sinocyclocheilus grahami]|uniref:general transcription factor II-I repeat domain-containing protein 2B-like n=1 Tax=Sinocyclocheilus grahami TaxID=75366 RepID=UPI0007AC5565|nr:PREDICTED: general transcription factor II-I repeat domain-containing protein 2B-like [Sinocyclocheilus grahami]
MSLSKPKRKVDEEHRQFQERWTLQYFFVEFNGNATCLICKEKVAVLKEYNLKRHYSTKHGEQYEKYQEDERKRRATQLQRELTSQQNLFHKAKKDADAAVEASYVVSELIAKAGKPFTEGQKNLFNNLSLTANTVAERISELSSDIYDQLRSKSKVFTAYSVALDESTDITDSAQLAIFIRGINDQFEVTEELLSLCPMHGRTTAKDIFQQLCDAIEHAGLLWNRLVGIATDGIAKNGLVALVQRKLEEENADPAVVLHSIIHQQELCSKCLKYEHVMSVVLKCINYIRSRSLQHRQFRPFVEEIESTYGDLLYFTEVHWLSRGNVLKRFFELRAEVKRFMEDGRMDVPEFYDPK